MFLAPSIHIYRCKANYLTVAMSESTSSVRPNIPLSGPLSGSGADSSVGGARESAGVDNAAVSSAVASLYDTYPFPPEPLLDEAPPGYNW